MKVLVMIKTGLTAIHLHYNIRLQVMLELLSARRLGIQNLNFETPAHSSLKIKSQSK